MLSPHDSARWQQFLGPLRATEWMVYAKPPIGGPGQVLKYLARYTHRVAIANRRLLALEDGRVTFRWKDYAHGNRHRTMTLDAVEFIRRFLLHILPCGFQRIRHYGLLANRVRQAKLGGCRALLQPPSGAASLGLPAHVAPPAPEEPRGVCPACQCGRLVWVATLQRQPGLCAIGVQPPRWDTS
jgi:Putative transposase